MSDGTLRLGAVRNVLNIDQQIKEQRRDAVIEQWILNNPGFVAKMKTLTKEQLVYKVIENLVGGAYDEVLSQCESPEDFQQRLAATFDLLAKLQVEPADRKLEALKKWEVEMLALAGNNVEVVAKIARIAGATSARIETLPKVKAVNAQRNGLKKAQIKGAENQKEYAAETNRIIEQLNTDLLNNPKTARQGIKERATYIEKKLVDSDRKQLNGKPYLYSTVLKKITGKG